MRGEPTTLLHGAPACAAACGNSLAIAGPSDRPCAPAPAPVPLQIPLLGPFVDTYSLWLSTRNAFLAWAMLGCRPPLYLAVPYQLAGLLRISRAGFCGSGVLLHPIVQQRTGAAGAGAG